MKFLPKKYDVEYEFIYKLWQDYEAFSKLDLDDTIVEIEKIILKKYKGNKHIAQLCKPTHDGDYPNLYHLIAFIEKDAGCSWIVQHNKYIENDCCGNCTNLTYGSCYPSCKLINDLCVTIFEFLPFTDDGSDIYSKLEEYYGVEDGPYKNAHIPKRHPLCKTLCNCKYLQRR